MRILGGRGRVEFHDALLKDINIFILDFAIPIRVLFYRIHTQNNIHAQDGGASSFSFYRTLVYNNSSGSPFNNKLRRACKTTFLRGHLSTK